MRTRTGWPGSPRSTLLLRRGPRWWTSRPPRRRPRRTCCSASRTVRSCSPWPAWAWCLAARCRCAGRSPGSPASWSWLVGRPRPRAGAPATAGAALLVWAAAADGRGRGRGAIGSALADAARSEAAARAEIARRAVSARSGCAMAQDVHDGVGHGLAVIAMQAGVAAARARPRPGPGPGAAGGDPRRPAGRRWTGCGPSWTGCAGRPAAPPAGPRPGWPTCRCCWTGSATAGCGCDVDARPAAAGRLPTEVGAAAYRIVQESLTNVLRHAGTGDGLGPASRPDGALRVEVADRARRRRAAPRAARGIAGMRRAGRVARRHAGRPGPGAGGGFAVRRGAAAAR